nr:DNA topoisomerase [Pseudomonas sp. R-28-1W-6]
MIITEKRDVAESMAKAMGWSRSGGAYTGMLHGKPVKAVWARGHLLQHETPDDINPGLGWDNPYALEQLPRQVKVVPIKEEDDNRTGSIKELLENIKQGLKGASNVILATDADREGEYIGWLILEHFNCQLPVQRCWLAAGMDERSIKQALGSLLPAYEKKPLARAAEARARSDWSYMYLVRAMTHYGRKGHMGKVLGTGSKRESVVSVGRVQSAALFMIYKREMEIRNFQARTFYGVSANFSVLSNLVGAEYSPKITQVLIDANQVQGISWEPQGLQGEGKLDRPLFLDHDAVKAFEGRLMGSASAAKVSDYSEGRREQHPPITYDLVEAKSALAAECKVTGDIAQAAIEDLYEQGFISYPRTAHGELPMNLYEPEERDTRLNVVAGIPALSVAAKRAVAIHTGADSQYKAFRPKVFVSKKLEHYGLIPSTREVDDQVLAGMQPKKKGKHTGAHMRAAYLLIATRYVQAMLPPAVLATQKVTFSVPVEDLLKQPESIFVAKAERTLDPGWRAIMNVGADKTAELPKLNNGQSATVESVEIREGKTKAPGRYSEQNIEKALQKAAREIDDPKMRAYLSDGENKPEGIGTPATRKDIIPTLKTRGYIRADKSAQFYLEDKGQEFIEFQMKHGHDWLYRIETTAQWEGRLADLALLSDDEEAKKKRDSFIEETVRTIENYIVWINSEFGNKTAVRESVSGPSVVTPKMKEIIKSIAERKGLTLPRGTLSEPEKAKAFLSEHIGKQDEKRAETTGTLAPTEAQLNLARKLAQASGKEPSPEELADRRKLSAYIDKHKSANDSASDSAPTEKMISFAKSIASKLAEKDKPKDNVFTSKKACKAFLDKHASRK